MTAFKKSANRAKAKTFEIKFKRLPLDISAFADILYRMPNLQPFQEMNYRACFGD
jgi:hypothetical protein